MVTPHLPGRALTRQNDAVYISAKADYVTRALLVLAAAPDGGPITASAIAGQQELPTRFIENSLVELKRSGLVRSVRGSSGGFKLGRPAAEITVADVIRAVEGPLAEIRGEKPEALHYPEPAQHLPQVWVAVRASLRSVLEQVTLADLASGELPEVVRSLTADPEAWLRR